MNTEKVKIWFNLICTILSAIAAAISSSSCYHHLI